MPLSVNEFIHPSDKKALDSLKAVPGFDLITKKFMNIVGERLFKIENTSSYIKLGPNQLPDIYNILVKICIKLQIRIPELYLSLERSPNAYTSGDTDIFIVITSGLLETMTLDQVETVIAHECGHILCHHVLYHTMGRYLINFSEFFINGIISRIMLTPLQYAFAYWMRCSEFSADRVSAYYRGDSAPVVDVMMALAGGTNNLGYALNKEIFLEQAKDYKDLVDNSSYNKVLEFIQFGMLDHPLNAYRAYEVVQFYKQMGDKFSLINSNCNILKENQSIYKLRVKFEYIKPKGFLGGVFDFNKLIMELGKEQYTIEKNGSTDITLQNGVHEILFTNGKAKTSLTIKLVKDSVIKVTWNGNDEKLSAIEME